MKKAIKILLIILLILVLIVSGAFLIKYYLKTHRNTDTIGRTQTEFTADENGTRITNIPFNKYIADAEKPADAVIPEISENASGEDNSKAVNNAIDSLTSGGVVYIPSGEYKVSTIVLKSNITLFVSKGAKLVSLNCDENEKSNSPLHGGVIYSENAENISVTGGGTICGSGESYTLEPEKTEPLYALKEFNLYTRVIESRKRIRFGKDTVRNNIINFVGCKNVSVDNIVLEESASWTFVLNSCENVTVKNTVIDNNMHVANTDGIDICASSNVSVSNCFIATGDDAIVLKSNDGEIENISVENCMLSSFANCFKIGTETQFDVKSVSVKNCKFFLPSGITGGYAGITIESADGANISDIKIDNIEMDGISSPVLIWLGDRLKYDRKEVGSISNVNITNVNAVNTELPSAVTGCKHKGEIYRIENVTLKNIKSVYRDTGEKLDIRENVSDASMNGYPEITRVSHFYFQSHELSGYWDLPCYSLFMRYTRGVECDIKTTPRKCSKLCDTYIQDVTEK